MFTEILEFYDEILVSFKFFSIRYFVKIHEYGREHTVVNAISLAIGPRY